MASNLLVDSGVRGQRASSLLGLVAAALLVVHSSYTGQEFMPSYLFVWFFLLGLSLGAMALVFVHNLTGGAWGELIRPILEALVRMLPYCALLAIPLLLRLPDLYTWMRSSDIAVPDVETVQSWYLNATFFWIRWILYFSVWIFLSFQLQKRSPHRTPGADPPAASRFQAASAVGLVLFLLTTTFASIDWTMSLTPQWHSTEFGLLAAIAQSLSALAFSVVSVAWFKSEERESLCPAFHDLGNLLLALVLFWSYLAFMQFLIIWIEDLPNDISWYLPRAQKGWRSLTLFLACVHFAIPFLVLLSRRVKRMPQALGLLAALQLFACLTDTFWLVVPPFRPQGLQPQWNDLLVLLAVGGVWFGLLIRIARTPAAPTNRTQTQGPVVRHA